MKYVVTIAGREVTVDVEGSAVTVNGRAVRATLDGTAGQMLRRRLKTPYAGTRSVTPRVNERAGPAPG